MIKKILHHPLRSMGAALTAVGAGVVFVVLILPAIAAGGSPGGKPAVTGYLNDKGKKTQKIPTGEPFFTLLGKDFGVNASKVTDIGCWENFALSPDPSEPKNGHWTAVSDWNTSDSYSKAIFEVDLNDDCAGVHGTVIAVQFVGEDGVAGDSQFGDDPGSDPGDDVIVYGPPVAITGGH